MVSDVCDDVVPFVAPPRWTVLFEHSYRLLAFVSSSERAVTSGPHARQQDDTSPTPEHADTGGLALATDPAIRGPWGGEVGRWVPGVLLVDDEEDIRVLLRAVIEAATRGFEVVGQAATGEEAIERCRQTNPDVILLDQRMPGLTGLETAELILKERPDQQIILFSAFLDDSTIRRAAALGIRACLPKGDFAGVPDALWKVTGA